MSEFEYIVGFHTIVLGLATAKVLTTLSDTLKYRESIKGFWVHSLWCVIVQLNIIGFWYAIWRIHSENTAFSYAEFLAYFSVSVSFYLASSFLSLDLGDDKKVDLEQHFFRVKFPALASFSYVFLFFAAVVLFGSPIPDEAQTTGMTLLDWISLITLPALVAAALLLNSVRAQQVIVALYAIIYVVVELNQSVIGGA